MFNQLELLPPDPILGLITRFKEDKHPQKIDLGVGVYKNEAGLTPVLNSVQKAEEKLLREQTTKAYIGPMGPPQFNEQMKHLVLGQDHSAMKEQRIAMVQTPGGCGALRVAAELILRAKPSATIWVSDPTWGNHIPLLGDSGIKIKTYPYYDFQKHGLCFDEMLEALAKIPRGDLVLLHGCCHNPSGADLAPEQWQEILKLAQKNGFVPFVDLAYQGFGEGLDQDAYGLRLLAQNLPELILAVSCSKNFGLYRERVGAIGVVTSTSSEASIVGSHIANIVRGIYSMPPSHGAAIVAEILTDSHLASEWNQELSDMRGRLNNVRVQLVQQLNAKGMNQRFDFLAQEKGMFSFLGISGSQINALAKQYGIHMLDSSRISLSGFNAGNIEYFCHALSEVLVKH